MVVAVDVEEVVSLLDWLYCSPFLLLFLLFSYFWIGTTSSCIYGCRLQYYRSVCIATFIRVVTAGKNQEEPIPRMCFLYTHLFFHTLLSLYTNHLHLLYHLTCKKRTWWKGRTRKRQRRSWRRWTYRQCTLQWSHFGIEKSHDNGKATTVATT